MAHDTSATTDQVTERHPRALAPANLILTVLLSVFGALIGIQIIATLGITPSTSLLGALVAMTLSRIPLTIFRGFRNLRPEPRQDEHQLGDLRRGRQQLLPADRHPVSSSGSRA